MGVSSSNFHWFVLGTDERSTKAGRATGKIRDIFKSVVPSATVAARGKMLEAARKKVDQVLAKELAKKTTTLATSST